jgi:ABC-type oligopeptide transport system ATPase subunit
MQVEVPKDNDAKIPQTDLAERGIVPKHPFRLLLVGSSGSGKSVVASHLLRNVYAGYFDRLIIFSPTAEEDPAYRGITKRQDYRKELVPREIDNLFQTQKSKVKAYGKAKAPRMCILFDDVIAENKFMNTPAFMKCFFQSRHGSISVILCAQSYMRVPRSARLNATDLILFPASESEIIRIAKEYTPPHTKQKQFEELIKHATREKYSFLYIATLADEGQKYRRKFEAYLELNSSTNEDPETVSSSSSGV